MNRPPSPGTSDCDSVSTISLISQNSEPPAVFSPPAPSRSLLYTLDDLKDSTLTAWRFESARRPDGKRYTIISPRADTAQQIRSRAAQAFLEAQKLSYACENEHPLTSLCQSGSAAETLRTWHPTTLRRFFESSQELLTPSDARLILNGIKIQLDPVDKRTLEMLASEYSTYSFEQESLTNADKILTHLLIKYICFAPMKAV